MVGVYFTGHLYRVWFLTHTWRKMAIEYKDTNENAQISHSLYLSRLEIHHFGVWILYSPWCHIHCYKLTPILKKNYLLSFSVAWRCFRIPRTVLKYPRRFYDVLTHRHTSSKWFLMLYFSVRYPWIIFTIHFLPLSSLS